LYLSNKNNKQGIKKLTYTYKDKNDTDVHNVKWSSSCLLKQIDSDNLNEFNLLSISINCANSYIGFNS